MRRVRALAATAMMMMAALSAGCGGSSHEARNGFGTSGCRSRLGVGTRSGRSRGVSFAMHRPDGTLLQTVSVGIGERVCVAATETNDSLSDLHAVERAPAGARVLAVELVEERDGVVLRIMNGFRHALSYAAAASLGGKQFGASSCPIASGAVGEARYDDDIESVALYDFALYPFGREPKACDSAARLRPPRTRIVLASRIWDRIEELR